MYARQIVEERLKKASTRLQFEPRYYSSEELDRNKSDLQALVDHESGQLTRKLTPDEITFIRNERVLCACDYSHYQSYCHIVGWDGKLTRYVPNIAQKILMDIRAEMEVQGYSIEMFNLKARRLGVSTEEEMAVAHRTQFWTNTYSIIASADDEMSAQMSQMIETNWNHMPWFLMPQITRYNVGELIEFGGLNSRVSMQSGSQLKGIGRGQTPSVIHLSEVAWYKNPEDLIEASLFRAIIPNPWILLLLETTAAGRFGWVYDTWNLSTEHWPNTRLRPVFLPWFCGSDIYPSETWLKQHPIPEGWHPAEMTIKHAQKAASYVRMSDVLSKYLGSRWKMPREQMWWWEFNYREAKEKKLLAKFLQEVASDPQEAFQTGNIPCFDVEIITEHRQLTKQPLDVYGFNGYDIPEKLRPREREINPNKKPIDIVAHWNKTLNPIRLQLVPLRWEPSQSHLGKFLVFEHPENDEEYGVGVDTADGVGRDRSVESVLRKGNVQRNDAQVGLYSSPYVNSLHLWPITMAIGTYYSTVIRGMRRQCRLAIECRGNGETTQLELQKRGWHNFHPWLRMSAKNIRVSNSQTIGWYTMEWSRRLMLDWLINAVEDFWLDINAGSTVSELETLELDTKRQKLKAAYSCHDDEVMATGIILVSLHLLEVLRNSAHDRRKNDKVATEYLRYTPPIAASSLPEHLLNRRTVDQEYSEVGYLDIDSRRRLNWGR